MSRIAKINELSYVASASEVNRVINNVNAKFKAVEANGLGSKLTVDFKSVGPKVTFTKKNYGNQVDIIIPGVLELTRGDEQGLYNSAQENYYNDEGNNGPYGTQWNSYYTDSTNYGWHHLEAVNDRSYDTWRAALNNNAGEYIIGLPMVLSDNNTGRKFLIKFTSWTQGGNGGGFSYERYEINPSVDVVKEENDYNFVDVIVPGVLELKRGEQGGAIYNAALENYYDGNNDDNPGNETYLAPKGTEWNSQYTDNSLYGFDNITNVRSRKYDTLYNALDQSVGNQITSTDLIMHDIASDTYYKFSFSNWQGEGGNGMAYTRTLITLDEAIQFADGTSIRSLNDLQQNSGGYSNFDQSLNTGDTVTFHTINVDGIAAQTIETNSNGAVDNIKIGDDCYIGDGNLANGFVVKGQQSLAQGYIKYGNNPNAPVVGNRGSQRLNIAKLDGSAVVPEYADNAAAVTAGLAIGDIYRTGDLLKIRH